MFKAQTEKELKHDYLWRAACSVPTRGQIGIFIRSYYEHVIVERIHPEKAVRQTLPDNLTGKTSGKNAFGISTILRNIYLTTEFTRSNFSSSFKRRAAQKTARTNAETGKEMEIFDRRHRRPRALRRVYESL